MYKNFCTQQLLVWLLSGREGEEEMEVGKYRKTEEMKEEKNRLENCCICACSCAFFIFYWRAEISDDVGYDVDDGRDDGALQYSDRSDFNLQNLVVFKNFCVKAKVRASLQCPSTCTCN